MNETYDENLLDAAVTKFIRESGFGRCILHSRGGRPDWDIYNGVKVDRVVRKFCYQGKVVGMCELGEPYWDSAELMEFFRKKGREILDSGWRPMKIKKEIEVWNY